MSDTNVWTPAFGCDLESISDSAWKKLMEDFANYRRERHKAGSLPKVELDNTWTEITPETAEAMLLLNEANRKVSLGTVKYYARQMLAGEWKPTGQAILFSNKAMIDGQHRLWAAYLSRSTFLSFVIGDVPENSEIFAYLDNGKSRSGSDALATAGLDGMSQILSQVVVIAIHYDRHAYTAKKVGKIDRISPIEMIRYVGSHPQLRDGARLMMGEHSPATKLIHHKDVAAFFGFKVLESYHEERLDAFCHELGSIDEDADPNSPITAFQSAMEADATSNDPMTKHQILGALIKTFNHWIAGEPAKKVTLRVNEAFPRLLVTAPMLEAAE